MCTALREARDAGRRAWYVTVPAGDGRGAVEHCALDEDGGLTGAAVCDAAALRGLTAAGRAARRRRRCRTAARPSSSAWIRRRSPWSAAPGTSATEVAPLLARLGFRVVVVDDREEFASRRAVPGRARGGAAVRRRARGRRRGRARLRRHRHPRPRRTTWTCSSRRCASAPATSVSWPAAPSARAWRRRCARRGYRRRGHRPHPLAHRPRHRRRDAGRARREHRRRDRPGAVRRGRLSVERLAAIVLAAGRSSRMSAFKPLLEVEGRTLLEWAVGAFAARGHRRRGRRDGSPRRRGGARSAVRAGAPSSPTPDSTRACSRRSAPGWQALDPGVSRFFLLPADVPLVRPETIGKLARAAAAGAATRSPPTARRGHADGGLPGGRRRTATRRSSPPRCATEILAAGRSGRPAACARC